MPLIRRKRKHRFLRSPRFFRIFRRNTHASFSPGNRLELFEHGAGFFPALLDTIGNASNYIYLEFYLIRDDAIGRKFAEALLNAVKRGVEVFLIYHYIGCFDTPGAYFKAMQEGGVKGLEFNPPPFRRGLAWFDKRDHRKMAVIDGRRAFVGGINIADEYDAFGEDHRRWRDVAISLDGPAARHLQRLFLESWVGETGNYRLKTADTPQ